MITKQMPYSEDMHRLVGGEGGDLYNTTNLKKNSTIHRNEQQL